MLSIFLTMLGTISPGSTFAEPLSLLSAFVIETANPWPALASAESASSICGDSTALHASDRPLPAPTLTAAPSNCVIVLLTALDKRRRPGFSASAEEAWAARVVGCAEEDNVTAGREVSTARDSALHEYPPGGFPPGGFPLCASAVGQAWRAAPTRGVRGLATSALGV